jgi:hypothetical protein
VWQAGRELNQELSKTSKENIKFRIVQLFHIKSHRSGSHSVDNLLLGAEFQRSHHYCHTPLLLFSQHKGDGGGMRFFH